MPEVRTASKPSFDYVGSYERAIGEVVAACGSREAANRMLDELHRHYERTDFELKETKRQLWKEPERFAAEKARILANARTEVAGIIEEHVPHSGGHVQELIIGTSLAVAALMIPITYAVSTLAVATSIISIGSSYYIGFKLLKNWKLMASRENIASMAGKASPKKTIALPVIAKGGRKN